MRNAVRSAIVLVSVAAIAWACGSGDSSEFVDPTPMLDAGPIPPPIGTIAPPSKKADAGPSSCVKKTCASENANCGPIGDGCGGVIQCGTCTNNETCGGGGKPSTCGKPACTAKTCAQLGANCGAIGDGCGGLIASCGTCDGGICGGGGPSKCGVGGAGVIHR
jgi:hypothetical protein